MTFSQFMAFLAAAKHLNITRASEELCISQPAMPDPAGARTRTSPAVSNNSPSSSVPLLFLRPAVNVSSTFDRTDVIAVRSDRMIAHRICRGAAGTEEPTNAARSSLRGIA